MNTEEHICINCGRRIFEDDGMSYDVSASHNCMGCWYNIWCPDCGAMAKYYETGHTSLFCSSSWPKPDEWRIPTMTKGMKLKEKEEEPPFFG